MMSEKKSDLNQGIIGTVSAEVLAVGSGAKAEKNVAIAGHGEAESAGRITEILFLAANPAETDRLRLDEEMRCIDEAIQQAAFRDRFKINQHWATRLDDLQNLLLRHRPRIVHFSGHGSPSSEIILEGRDGGIRPVSIAALANLFNILKDEISCVVLNACYSEQQARAIAEPIECVIGMSKAVGDSSAIAFSSAFYRALAYGKTVKEAFDLGCSQIDLHGLNYAEVPKLFTQNTDSGNLVFA
jgi:CHAT domain